MEWCLYSFLRAGPIVKGLRLLGPSLTPSSPTGGFICPFPPLVPGSRDALMAPCSLSVRYLNGNRP